MILKRISWCCSLFFRLMRVMFQIIWGAWQVSKLPRPIVSIFGGARLAKTEKYWQFAHQLSNKLVEADISVLTGGGPGLMEAASCGAIPRLGGKGVSMGIGVKDLGEAKNTCVQVYCELDYFFARKWLLTRYSSGFIVFPGGFGTLDELAEVLTLIQTNRLERVPLVLIGAEYWTDFLAWVESEVLKHGLVQFEDLQLLTLTDNLEEAFCLIRDACKVGQQQKKGNL